MILGLWLASLLRKWLEKNYKISGAVDNQRQMEPAVKKEIYNAFRLGLSTVQGGANQEIFSGEVQTIGSKIKNMLNSCSSNCKMLQKSQI